MDEKEQQLIHNLGELFLAAETMAFLESDGAAVWNLMHDILAARDVLPGLLLLLLPRSGWRLRPMEGRLIRFAVLYRLRKGVE